MTTHHTTTGAADTTAAQSSDQITAALSQWVKLVRKDCQANALLNVDHWLLSELAILFKKLAQQAPEQALELLAQESRGLEQSIQITQAGAKA
jgi:hypothetical protein